MSKQIVVHIWKEKNKFAHYVNSLDKNFCGILYDGGCNVGLKKGRILTFT